MYVEGEHFNSVEISSTYLILNPHFDRKINIAYFHLITLGTMYKKKYHSGSIGVHAAQGFRVA